MTTIAGDGIVPRMALLLTGTVTFLLTDIEGSTRLWEHYPHQMREALARHDALIEALTNEHGGIVVRPWGEGDSRFCVFARASDAVAAAGAIQRALHQEHWPAETPLRVRLALHTGEADLRDGDYYGTAVNRCARLRAIAHGGQTLLSEATRDLVRDALPPEAALRDFGEQRLRDLARPERVYQLVTPEVPADFPSLLSLDTLPNNLPLQVTGFVGREREIAEIIHLQSEARLVTLTGTGGAGKTRLALQVAAEVLEHFPDGAWFVELASLADQALVPHAIASALEVREVTGQSLEATLIEALRPKRLLLVLDNCEHLLTVCVHLVSRLLQACPQLRVLATSRTPLRTSGEQEFPVPPLGLPDLGSHPDPEELCRAPSVALFVQRTRAVKPDFVLADSEARRIAEICVRLDGSPLAIELAAARTRLFSPQAMLARLLGAYGQTPLRLLTGGPQDAPTRQQTLRGAIDWSYELLSPGEQALFRRLSVFSGGCTFDAAEAVAGVLNIGFSFPSSAGKQATHPSFHTESEDLDVLDGLASLVEKSLVRQETQPNGEPRFSLLEMIREYGLERLTAAGELETARERHADFFLQLAETAQSQLHGPEQRQWLDRLDTEHDNLRAALRWLIDRRDSGRGSRLGAALVEFWWSRGHVSEGRDWLARLLHLQLPSELSSADAKGARATVLVGAGMLAHEHDEHQLACSYYEDALRLWRELEDRVGIATALTAMGDAQRYLGNYLEARSLLEEALPLWRALGDRAQIAQTLYLLGGTVGFYLGSQADGRAMLEESVRIRRERGDLQGAAWPLHILGVMAQRQGNFELAQRTFEDGLATRRAAGDELGCAYSPGRLAQLAIGRSDYAAASAHLQEALIITRRFGDRWLLAYLLDGNAAVCLAQEDPAGALQISGAAAELRRAVGMTLPPPEQENYDRTIARARASLDESDASAAWAWGQSLSLDEAIDLALAGGQHERTVLQPDPVIARPEVAPSHVIPSVTAMVEPLTRREREVASLIAEGLTNRLIAERLVISERTVDTHVANILGKLGFATRAQVAAWAVEQRLTAPAA